MSRKRYCAKQCHATRADAERAGRELVQATGPQPTLRAYRCRKCKGCWHIGHKDPLWTLFGRIEKERRASRQTLSAG